MKSAFHYTIKAKLIRFIKDGVIDFIEFNESFENENPILAREQAFKIYQNRIDVLLQGKELRALRWPETDAARQRPAFPRDGALPEETEQPAHPFPRGRLAGLAPRAVGGLSEKTRDVRGAGRGAGEERDPEPEHRRL